MKLFLFTQLALGLVLINQMCDAQNSSNSLPNEKETVLYLKDKLAKYSNGLGPLYEYQRHNLGSHELLDWRTDSYRSYDLSTNSYGKYMITYYTERKDEKHGTVLKSGSVAVPVDQIESMEIRDRSSSTDINSGHQTYTYNYQYISVQLKSNCCYDPIYSKYVDWFIIVLADNEDNILSKVINALNHLNSLANQHASPDPFDPNYKPGTTSKLNNESKNSNSDLTLTQKKDFVTEDSSPEEIVNFITNKLKCCKASSADTYGWDCNKRVISDYNCDIVMEIGNNVSLRLDGNYLRFDASTYWDILDESHHPIKCGDDLIYLPVMYLIKNNEESNIAIRFNFSDSETTEEVLFAFIYLKRALDK